MRYHCAMPGFRVTCGLGLWLRVLGVIVCGLCRAQPILLCFNCIITVGKMSNFIFVLRRRDAVFFTVAQGREQTCPPRSVAPIL